MGVHKKCQGLIDIDIDFKCDVCLHIQKLGTKNKTISCVYCLQSGGAMKMFLGKKKIREFYHTFCAMITGRFQDVKNMKKFVLNDEYLN